MLIIRKITHSKNFHKRKLHSHYEVGSLCKFLIVNGFENSRTHNAWSLLYTKESFQQLKTLFTELKIIASNEKKEQNIDSITKFATHLIGKCSRYLFHSRPLRTRQHFNHSTLYTRKRTRNRQSSIALR